MQMSGRAHLKLIMLLPIFEADFDKSPGPTVFLVYTFRECTLIQNIIQHYFCMEFGRNLGKVSCTISV